MDTAEAEKSLDSSKAAEAITADEEVVVRPEDIDYKVSFDASGNLVMKSLQERRARQKKLDEVKKVVPAALT